MIASGSIVEHDGLIDWRKFLKNFPSFKLFGGNFFFKISQFL